MIHVNSCFRFKYLLRLIFRVSFHCYYLPAFCRRVEDLTRKEMRKQAEILEGGSLQMFSKARSIIANNINKVCFGFIMSDECFAQGSNDQI